MYRQDTLTAREIFRELNGMSRGWCWLVVMVLVAGLVGCGSRQMKLREQLVSESVEERLQAVERLRQWDSPTAVELLQQALLDPDETVRVTAVEALGQRPEPEARQALLDVVQGEYWRKAALREYEKAVELGADEAGVRIAMGRLYKDLGNPDKALEQAEIAEMLAQEDVYQLMSIQFLYDDLGETDKAGQLQQRIQELQPGSMPGGTFTVPPMQ